jgi:hypothetical protein
LATKSDISTQLVLDGLTRAFAAPAGCPLHGGKDTPALFPNSAAARRAAQQCKTSGWLQTVGTVTKGRGALDVCTITEEGIAHLLGQVSPKPVLEEFVRAVEACSRQIADAVKTAERGQSALAALQGQLSILLNRMPTSNGEVIGRGPFACFRGLASPNGTAAANQGRESMAPGTVPDASDAAKGAGDSSSWKSAALTFLSDWPKAKPSEDCPVSELYHHLRQSAPHLTIGQFHDGLRQLHADGAIYLHPWTGPLSEIPEPTIALLVGHMIAYYASQREMNNEERTMKNEQ